jgi:methylated-DNA-[protein]-cysteine S-methyltransferase
MVLQDGRLAALDFLLSGAPLRQPRDSACEQLVAWIDQYFRDPCAVFDLPITLAGTPFQRRVWAALRTIPPGAVRRYGDLAGDIGTSPRAVGNACRANALPIVIPCHRVIGATGLGGYAGATAGQALDTKAWLLRHEARCT